MIQILIQQIRYLFLIFIVDVTAISIISLRSGTGYYKDKYRE